MSRQKPETDTEDNVQMKDGGGQDESMNVDEEEDESEEDEDVPRNDTFSELLTMIKTVNASGDKMPSVA